MPDWLKITAVTERESATRIWEALDTLGALAVTVESAEDNLDCDEFIPGLPKWRRQAVSGLSIWITPGLAFGTGKHPGTALCLERLATLKLTDTTVLDWGCGSGILAVAALKLGASKALGVDIDHRALAARTRHKIL